MERPSDAGPCPPACAAWLRPSRRAMLWWSLTALLSGAMLGVLAGMSYDALLGLPEGASTVLKSLAFTATWAWMGSGSLAQGQAALYLAPEGLPVEGDPPEIPS